MEHTISRNNAQYIFSTACALLRNLWGEENQANLYKSER